MPYDNSQNTGKGHLFQVQAAEMLSNHFNVVFQPDFAMKIGNPPKEHRFDLVSIDLRYVSECKNYSWTESGNISSAKIASINESVFYLSFLPKDIIRFVNMRKDVHPMRKETLAEYYYRTNSHLLGDIFIIEVDLESKAIKEIGRAIR